VKGIEDMGSFEDEKIAGPATAAPRVGKSQTRHAGWGGSVTFDRRHLGHFLCGVGAGFLADSTQAITCLECREAIKRDRWAPPGFDPRYLMCGCQIQHVKNEIQFAGVMRRVG
jgi:hypothetical protein